MTGEDGRSGPSRDGGADGIRIRVGDRIVDGVEVVPLRRIPDDRGTVHHMLKSTDPHFRSFGEVYFSSVYHGVVKAWKNHDRVTVNYACVHGRVKVVVYDGRRDSPTRGAVTEVFLGPDHYALVVIPPGVWSGFQGMSRPTALVANCATEPHDPDEFRRLPPEADDVPYAW